MLCQLIFCISLLTFNCTHTHTHVVRQAHTQRHAAATQRIQNFCDLGFTWFFGPVTRERFLRSSFCTLRVLVPTTDVQRNATATTRFADGSWTPPKAAAAEPATATAVAKAFALGLALSLSLSLVLCLPFSNCRKA